MRSLQIMDSNFNKLGEIVLYESLQLTRSYYEIGSISLTIDPRAKNALTLAPDVIVFFGDDPENAYLIEDVSPHQRSKLTVKGCMLKGLAKRRVCVPPVSSEARQYQDFGWDRFTGSAEASYQHFASNNLVAPDDINRAIPRLILASNKDRGAVLPWQARFDKLESVFRSIGERTEIGWNIRLDIQNKQFIFDVWDGLDRTQGNLRCLISEENGNASDLTYKCVKSASMTTAYIGGAGEDEERMILAEGGSVAGLLRREMWAEAGSLDDPELISLFAQNKLTDAAAKVTITANLIDSGACRYRRDYDVGDKVLLSGRGVYTGTRIMSITETYEKGVRTLSGTFGDAPITIGKLLDMRQNATR